MNTLPAPSHIVGSKWFLSGKTKWIGVERAKMVRNRKDVDASVSVATVSSNSSASASATGPEPSLSLPNVVEVVVMDEPSEQELRIAALEAQVAEARAEIARLRASSARFAELLAAAAAAAASF